MKLPENMPVRKTQCSTCVFRPESDGGISLAPGRREEISMMLLSGTNQICHKGNKSICRGGRDFQLQCWSRMGIIAEPTDAALAEAMATARTRPTETKESK